MRPFIFSLLIKHGFFMLWGCLFCCHPWCSVFYGQGHLWIHCLTLVSAVSCGLTTDSISWLASWWQSEHWASSWTLPLLSRVLWFQLFPSQGEAWASQGVWGGKTSQEGGRRIDDSCWGPLPFHQSPYLELALMGSGGSVLFSSAVCVCVSDAELPEKPSVTCHILLEVLTAFEPVICIIGGPCILAWLNLTLCLGWKKWTKNRFVSRKYCTSS